MNQRQDITDSATFDLRTVARIIGAQAYWLALPSLLAGQSSAVCAGSSDESFCKAVSTDSRRVQPGQIYLALKGEKFDGNDFVLQALGNGASACIIDSQNLLEELRVSHSLQAQSVAPGSGSRCALILSVDDCLAAYHRLARHWLLLVSPTVIAVTGSSGKTTTKEMAAAVFSLAGATHYSAANENNEIGVPKTILTMPVDTKYLILEMAMRGSGQIAQLAAMATPDIGIITCAGTAHIELLGNESNIARAKCELLPYIQPDGWAILGQNSALLLETAADNYAGQLEILSAGCLQVSSSSEELSLFTMEKFASQFRLHAGGKHNVIDAWCVIQAASKAGILESTIVRGLGAYRPIAGRGKRHTTISGARLIDESYNANPESMRCAIEAAFSDAGAFKQRVAILGPMAELGEHAERLHVELGLWLKEASITRLYTVGETAALIADGAADAPFNIHKMKSQRELFDELIDQLNEDYLIVVKGSHSGRLDRLVNSLVANDRGFLGS